MGILERNWLVARGPRYSPTTSLHDLAGSLSLSVPGEGWSGKPQRPFLLKQPFKGPLNKQVTLTLLLLAGPADSPRVSLRSASFGSSPPSDITSWPPPFTTQTFCALLSSLRVFAQPVPLPGTLIPKISAWITPSHSSGQRPPPLSPYRTPVPHCFTTLLITG